MDEELRRAIRASADKLTCARDAQALFSAHECGLPDRGEVIKLTEELRALMFPGYFGNVAAARGDYAAGHALTDICRRLNTQLIAAFGYAGDCRDAAARASECCARFIPELPGIQTALIKDVDAAFNGDPAAKSRADVVFSYPGLYAIAIYRLAHLLYQANVPYIPRIMTEHAHSLTGIDINAGAQIGEYFFIDHGTGVVVGETTIIGDHVKLYQGVTLGALSTRQGQSLAGVKRHPTLGNRVTVYSGATILGGETVIGDDCVIGGNAFVTASVPAHTRVSVKSPELTFREVKKTIWENA